MNKLIQGDSKEILRTFEDNSFHGMLTDPPAGISFMGQEWDTFPKGGRGNSCRKTGSGNDCSSPGFACDVHWDKSLKARNQFINWLTDLMTEAKRILKPGGHAFVWALPRTSHWTAFALEEAGFEIRDCMYHIFGQGFSKSLDISKDIDRRVCRKQLEKELDRKPTKDEFRKVWKGFREVVGHKPIAYPDSDCWGIPNKNGIGNDKSIFNVGKVDEGGTRPITASITPEAKRWEGWGTGLKPAVECWWLVRKPLSEKTVAENILKWGTGGINIEEGRITYKNNEDFKDGHHNKQLSENVKYKKTCFGSTFGYGLLNSNINKGRFPANLIHDGSPEVMKEFEKYGVSVSKWGRDTRKHTNPFTPNLEEDNYEMINKESRFKGDSGTPARFFYCAKSSRSERWFYCQICQDAFPIKEREDHKHSKPDSEQKHIILHPTQKSEKLCKYLIQLITREGQIVLDPFMGTGTTCVACINTNRNYVGIELGIEYYEIARKRIEYIERKKQSRLFLGYP